MSSDARYALASKLAQFLRKNGDKVLHGSCKLSLTTSALCLLNSLFTEYVHSDFQSGFQLSDSGMSGINEDVKYLYDFMKRTTSLKLFHENQTLRGGVDLSHFTNLTVLELRKIPAHLIVGLTAVSSQLKALICSRSIYLLKELFNVADEEENHYAWNELKELNLSYNYLGSIDNSVEVLQNLEILDLSHNNIIDTNAIQVLKKLKFLNLSYNLLERLPRFNSLCCRFLNKLYVRNNSLETLDGLECLFNLEEFDVGYNLLTEYSSLSGLDKLKSLRMLNLEGNPIYFHKQCLKFVLSYLHPDALNRGIQVNGKLILIPRSTVLGVGPSCDFGADASQHQTSINTLVGDMQNVRPSEVPGSFASRFSPLTSVEVVASSYTSQSDLDQDMDKKISKSRKSKKSKNKLLREALISEPGEVDTDLKVAPKDAFHNVAAVIPSHIKAKQELEARREERGPSWLIPDHPFQNSFPKVPANTPVVNETVPLPLPVNLSLSHERSLKHLTADVYESKGPTFQLSKDTELKEISEIQQGSPHLERKRHTSKDSDDIEVLAANLQGTDDGIDVKEQNGEHLSECEDFYDSCNLNDSAIEASGENFDDESEEELEDSLFFVEKITDTGQHMISVNIGPKFATEKDAMTAKVIDKLDLSCLSSVNLVTEKDEASGFQVNLTFLTTKTSRQKRCYVFTDLDSAQHLSKLLQPFADANTLKEATIGALECLKCQAQFSKSVAHLKVIKKKVNLGKEVLSSSFDFSKEQPEETYACPNCGNIILVELETMPLPSVAAPPSMTENRLNVPKKSPTDTPDTSSVGSASSGNLFSSLFSSIRLSPITKKKSVSVPLNESIGDDSYQSRNTTESVDSDKKSTDTNIRRNSSDITIISNPSQSSIAVIPDPLENNLNTILEKDSLGSLSPPISGGSTISASLGLKAIDAYLKNKDPPAGPADQDFYSLESYGEQERAFKYSDMTSNDSDIYHSPDRSINPSNMEDESSFIMQILSEKTPHSYDFLELDHRLKLHLEINVFGDNEHLTVCLESSIVPLSTGEEFIGMFVLSSKNVYIVKFLSSYCKALERNEPLGKQIQVLHSGPLSQIKQIKSLMGNQGISIGCGPATHIYTLFIKDADTCNSFLNIISEQITSHNPQLEILRDTTETFSVLCESVLLPPGEASEVPQILLHQFASLKDKDFEYPVCLILTPDEVILSRILYKKQQSCTNLSDLHPYCYTDVSHQQISDVVSLKLMNDLICVEICFLSEARNIQSLSWTVLMKTKSSMFSFISALKSPWEELFGVPLPLSMVEDCS